MKNLLVLFAVIVLAACGSVSTEVQFFNDTVDWTYKCLPIGEEFQVTGSWDSRYPSDQRFIAEPKEGGPVGGRSLGIYYAYTYLPDGLSLPIVALSQNSRFGLVRQGTYRGHRTLVSSGETVFKLWDFDEQFALISEFPGFNIKGAQPIGMCDHLAPKRLRGKLN